MNPDLDYYAILDVAHHCGFGELKKAYYRQAKACHPDHHGGSRQKAVEFQRLVEAFNILSDPVQRRCYDQQRRAFDGTWDAGDPGPVYYFPEDEGSILDTHADDILEELIVGNILPTESSLQTLMLDLERTERFCQFREAKNFFFEGNIAASAGILREYLRAAPGNILAHYFLGRCFSLAHQWKAAENEYVAAINIGTTRRPPLRLTRLRGELDALRRKNLGFIARLRAAFAPTAGYVEPLTPAEEMRRTVGRTITRILMEERRKRRSLPEG